MKDLIVLSGAPGSGKTTLAKQLQKELGSVHIDFGWLRQFHLDKEWNNASESEEQMTFENLVFIVKNYIQHGYKNIILTDFKDSLVQKIPNIFHDYNFIIVSLVVNDDEELKRRVLGPRDSGFKDFETSLEWNRNLIARPTLSNECRIDNSHNNPEQTTMEILKLL
jgi:adenylate kinase family enzyme